MHFPGLEAVSAGQRSKVCVCKLQALKCRSAFHFSEPKPPLFGRAQIIYLAHFALIACLVLCTRSGLQSHGLTFGAAMTQAFLNLDPHVGMSQGCTRHAKSLYI